LIALIALLSLLNAQVAMAKTQEPQSGELELVTMDATGNTNLSRESTLLLGLQLNSKANISINGMVATIELEQHFQNPSDQWVEGRYVFPLPDDAAVNTMEMKIAERIIKATIEEKTKAKKIYTSAKAAGKKQP
jgi:Ca-activated chloride channel family protein